MAKEPKTDRQSQPLPEARCEPHRSHSPLGAVAVRALQLLRSHTGKHRLVERGRWHSARASAGLYGPRVRLGVSRLGARARPRGRPDRGDVEAKDPCRGVGARESGARLSNARLRLGRPRTGGSAHIAMNSASRATSKKEPRAHHRAPNPAPHPAHHQQHVRIMDTAYTRVDLYGGRHA